MDRLWVKFFMEFSKFECALKRAGFLRNTKKDSLAEPDWKQFAKSLPEDFFAKVISEENVDYLVNKPPSRQVVTVNKKLSWSNESKAEDTQSLIRAVKNVRNNMFHGGKYEGALVEGSERDKKLIDAALKVLKLAKAESQRIQKHWPEDV